MLPYLRGAARLDEVVDTVKLARMEGVATDMARVAGVPVRTLFELFKRYKEETPADLLRRKRLEAVRRRLVEASPYETTVTDAAMACGFVHLGRFAQYYSAEYGEKPSDTLLRRRHHS